MSVLDDCFRGTGTDADQFRLLVLDVLERLPLIRERSPQVGDEVAKLEEVLRDFLAYAYGDRSNPSAQQQVQEVERHRQPAGMRRREPTGPRSAAPEGGDQRQDEGEYQ